KFDVEGWDRRLSLREVESAIQSKSAERLKLHNFLRPSRRETIQGQIDYLHEAKADIQEQLAARERLVNKDLAAAQIRYDTATKQAENVARTRTVHGRALPLPIFNRDELSRMTVIATRNKDGPLLQYVYDQVRDRLLQNPTEEALS